MVADDDDRDVGCRGGARGGVRAGALDRHREAGRLVGALGPRTEGAVGVGDDEPAARDVPDHDLAVGPFDEPERLPDHPTVGAELVVDEQTGVVDRDVAPLATARSDRTPLPQSTRSNSAAGSPGAGSVAVRRMRSGAPPGSAPATTSPVPSGPNAANPTRSTPSTKVTFPAPSRSTRPRRAVTAYGSVPEYQSS